MRRMIRPLVALAARWVDSAAPAERVKAFLTARLGQFRAEHTAEGRGWGGPRAIEDLAEACELADQAGLFPSSLQRITSNAPRCRSMELDEWIDGVPDGQVITARRLVAGTGQSLAAIQTLGDGFHKVFLGRSLEALLRNVEIRREKCLQPLLPAAHRDVLWLEKHDIAVLFASTARVRGDLRFLNAAFKLNDWAFRSHCRIARGPRLARYLLALSHQELAVVRLLS